MVIIVVVNGTFQHHRCSRFSVTGMSCINLTCSYCGPMLQSGDLRMRVVRENTSLEKRGSKGIGLGRHLRHLFV